MSTCVCGKKTLFWNGPVKIQKSLIFLFCLAIGISVFTPALAGTVQISGDRVSIRADGEPLQNLLKTFAGFGIKIRIDPEINPAVSVKVDNRDIQSALKILLKNINYVLFWETITGPLGPVLKISEIRVFYPGEEARVVTLTPGIMGDIITDPRTGDRYVAGELLLKLQPGLDIIAFNRLLVKIGGTLIGSNPDLGIYRIRVPMDADIPSIVKILKSSPGVVSAEPNFAYPLFTPSIGGEQLQLNHDTRNQNLLGQAPPVAVLDTGIVKEFGLDTVLLGQFNAADPENSADDFQGHGTQMALIASGIVLPAGISSDFATVPVLAVKAVDDNGYVSNFSMMLAIGKAFDAGCRVMSLSWGAETRSGFLETALGNASQRGMIVVASAGNEPVGTPVYPAAYGSVIGVGALKPGGDPWEESNFGEFVSIWAPGFANFPIGFKGNPGTYAGTSISTAYVANRVSRYLALHPEASLDEILEAVKRANVH